MIHSYKALCKLLMLLPMDARSWLRGARAGALTALALSSVILWVHEMFLLFHRRRKERWRGQKKSCRSCRRAE